MALDRVLVYAVILRTQKRPGESLGVFLWPGWGKSSLSKARYMTSQTQKRFNLTDRGCSFWCHGFLEVCVGDESEFTTGCRQKPV